MYFFIFIYFFSLMCLRSFVVVFHFKISLIYFDYSHFFFVFCSGDVLPLNSVGDFFLFFYSFGVYYCYFFTIQNLIITDTALYQLSGSFRRYFLQFLTFISYSFGWDFFFCQSQKSTHFSFLYRIFLIFNLFVFFCYFVNMLCIICYRLNTVIFWNIYKTHIMIFKRRNKIFEVHHTR